MCGQQTGGEINHRTPSPSLQTSLSPASSKAAAALFPGLVGVQSPLLLIFIIFSCRFCCSLQLHLSQDCAMQTDGSQGASLHHELLPGPALCFHDTHVHASASKPVLDLPNAHRDAVLHALCMLTFYCIQTLLHHMHHQVADCFPRGGLECENHWATNVPMDPGTPMHWWRVNESQHHLCSNFFEMQSTPLIFQHFPPSPKQNLIGREQWRAAQGNTSTLCLVQRLHQH